MRRYQQAFTLIELMVTLIVLAVLVAIAIPSFNIQIQNNRSVALGEELVTAINFTRAEAVKRGRRVSICASNDGAACGGQWRDGMIAFVDDAASDTAAPTVTEVLRIWQSFTGRAIITESNGKTFIRYTMTGMLARVDANPIDMNASFQGCRGEAGRRITVGLGGMVNVARSVCPESDNDE